MLVRVSEFVTDKRMFHGTLHNHEHEIGPASACEVALGSRYRSLIDLISPTPP